MGLLDILFGESTPINKTKHKDVVIPKNHSTPKNYSVPIVDSKMINFFKKNQTRIGKMMGHSGLFYDKNSTAYENVVNHNALHIKISRTTNDVITFKCYYRGQELFKIYLNDNWNGPDNRLISVGPIDESARVFYDYSSGYIENNVFTQDELDEAVIRIMTLLLKKFDVKHKIWHQEQLLANQERENQKKIKENRYRGIQQTFLKEFNG